MGSIIELNDTLQLTTEQGFPSEFLNYEKHLQTPIPLEEVQGRTFQFYGKTSARLFHLDPVRVYLAQNIDGKWLFWGRALIQSLHIEKKMDQKGSWAGQWVTSGTFIIQSIYHPEYQRMFTLSEAPPKKCFFK